MVIKTVIMLTIFLFPFVILNLGIISSSWLLFLLYINVNYSQDSIYKEFFFNSGEISSKGYLINNLPGGKWVSYYSNSKIKSIGY